MFNYGGQKLQFSEQQRLMMIGKLAGDSKAHYTYSAAPSSPLFPRCHLTPWMQLQQRHAFWRVCAVQRSGRGAAVEGDTQSAHDDGGWLQVASSEGSRRVYETEF